MIAHLLVSEGFKKVETVAYVPIEELKSIGGFDEKLAEELKSRAITFLEEKEEELEKNSSIMTRIDLTDLNDARTRVNRLEGACEALDIIRTTVLGAESKIHRTEETTA